MSLTNILIESLDEFIKDNSITLYHYSNENKESLNVTPSEFGKNTWSKSEKKASTYPRSFFYVDLDDTERFFKNKTQYKAIVDKDSIYDLTKDPEGFIKQIKSDNNGVLNMDTLLETIHNSGYMGAYYEVRIKIVILFEPITAKKVNSETKFHKNMKEKKVRDILENSNVAIMSTHRTENTDEVNTNNDTQFVNEMLQSNFNFTEAKGGFIENLGKENETASVEKSFMIWSENAEALKKKVMKLLKKYNQESALWMTEDDPMGYFLEPSGKLEKVGAFVPNEKGEYFTQVGSFSFVFR